MTAYGTIESAVEAMRLGAFDYIQKPFTEQELLVKVSKALESRKLARPGPAVRRGVQGALPLREHRRPLPGDPRRARPRRCGSRRPTRPCSSPARAAPARSSSREPSTPTSLRAERPFVAGQLRGHHRDAARERAVRPRARRLHRRRQRAQGPVRGGRRRHVLLRRDRRDHASRFRRSCSARSRKAKFVASARTSR